MSVQTAVNTRPSRAYDGQRADMSPAKVVSKTVETTAIPFGRVVTLGSTAEKVVLGGAAPAGLTMRELELEGGIPAVGERVAVITDGGLCAVVDGAGDAGDALNYDSVTGRLTTAAVAGNVVAFPAGSVVLRETKLDNAAEADNIVPVSVNELA